MQTNLCLLLCPIKYYEKKDSGQFVQDITLNVVDFK